MAKSQDRQRLEEARKVLRRHYRRLMRRRGVTGVDVGYRLRRGEYTREISIRVHVAEKHAPDCLRSNQKLPETLDQIPVDVIVRNYRFCYSVVEARRFRDPVRGGAAIAPIRRPTAWGTLGMVVFDPSSEEARYLTTAHLIPPPSRRIRQPPFDPVEWPEDAQKVIGQAIRRRLSLFVDCALIQPTGSRRHRRGILGLRGPFTLGRLSDADQLRQTTVVKRGAQTGKTTGFIDNISARIDMPGHGTFIDQICIRSRDDRPFIDEGDSGSVLLRPDTKEVVGLIHGMTDEGMGIASHFDKVVSELAISIE